MRKTKDEKKTDAKAGGRIDVSISDPDEHSSTSSSELPVENGVEDQVQMLDISQEKKRFESVLRPSRSRSTPCSPPLPPDSPDSLLPPAAVQLDSECRNNKLERYRFCSGPHALEA